MIAPIPFGICVDADKFFGTRWFLDHLVKFGFSISSDEVNLFKLSAASANYIPGDQVPYFTQWAADNVDHNIRTLTGKITFHGIGIISISSSKLKYEVIHRLKHHNVKELASVAVKIINYEGSSINDLRKLQIKPIKYLAFSAPEMNLDLVWNATWHFISQNNQRPNWSGYMMHVTSQAPTLYEATLVKFYYHRS